MRFDEQVLYNNSESAILKIFHSAVTPMKRLYNVHHHTECELSLFISGRGIYKTYKDEYLFSKGDIFLFGSNEAHCITEIYSDINLLNIHFEPRVLYESSESAVSQAMQISTNYLKKLPKKRRLIIYPRHRRIKYLKKYIHSAVIIKQKAWWYYNHHVFQYKTTNLSLFAINILRLLVVVVNTILDYTSYNTILTLDIIYYFFNW